jgi:hypothetical protein
MRTILTSALLFLTMVAAGCQSPNASSSAAVEATPKAEVPSKTEVSEKVAPQATSHVEKALRMAKHPFKRARVSVTDAQLERIVASSYEVFDTKAEPLVRVFVFHYDALELVQPAKIARWINESGLIHHGQTSANRLRIVVAGTPVAGPLEEEASDVMNDFMDAFMVMR